MPELRVGSVVQRISVHDWGFFALVIIYCSFSYLADGRSRLLDKPKKKNPKHLRVTNTVIDPMRMETNKKLKQALWPFNYGGLTPSDE